MAIALGARAKKPGPAMVGADVELFMYDDKGDEMQAYERLLGDALRGDATLFTRQDAVEAAWRIVDPVLDRGPPPRIYRGGTWGPAEADAIAGRAGWYNPRPTPAAIIDGPFRGRRAKSFSSVTSARPTRGSRSRR